MTVLASMYLCRTLCAIGCCAWSIAITPLQCKAGRVGAAWPAMHEHAATCTFFPGATHHKSTAAVGRFSSDRRYSMAMCSRLCSLQRRRPPGGVETEGPVTNGHLL